MAEGPVAERGVLTAHDEVWDTAERQAEVIGPLAEKARVGLADADEAAAMLGKRRPLGLLAGLRLHVAASLPIIPAVAFLLQHSPDSDGSSSLVTTMILIVAMPAAAGTTCGPARADQPTMAGLVIASWPARSPSWPVVGLLTPQLSTGYANVLGVAGPAVNGEFVLRGVVLPCSAGISDRVAA